MKDFKNFKMKIQGFGGGNNILSTIPMTFGIPGVPFQMVDQEEQRRSDRIRKFASKLEEYFEDPKRRLEALNYHPQNMAEKVKAAIKNREAMFEEISPTDTSLLMDALTHEDFVRTPFMQPYAIISSDETREEFAKFLVDYVFPHMGGVTAVDDRYQQAMFNGGLACIHHVAQKATAVYAGLGNPAFDSVLMQPVIFQRKDGTTVVGGICIYSAAGMKQDEPALSLRMSVVWWDAAFYLKDPFNESTTHIH